ncbi:MAG: AbrB/MazE/SpoVT family DNA-binding domain-containing protein [Gammaproteobacteria bacterium]
MSRVTSKLQVTIPKRIAEQFAIKPGDEIDFIGTADGLRVKTGARGREPELSVAERLRLFDQATERQRRRQAGTQAPASPSSERGWTREELYTRGEPR